MKLIDKVKLLEELKKCEKICEDYMLSHKDAVSQGIANAKRTVCQHIIKIINTLEVKEVSLENSMTCEVGWYDGFLLDYTQEQQDELLKKIGANVGDKIRVILIKE